MTDDKALKRAIRSRMEKTGERYTAARRHVIDKKNETPSVVADPGMSDDTIKRGSGKSWNEWFRILDSWEATGRSHGEIAAHLIEKHNVPGWWAQSVTVGYERARGIRAAHQRASGFYVTVSKTVPVNVDRLFDAFTDSNQRRRWLESGTLRARTSQPSKSARFDFRDGVSRVHVYFVAKGPSKSSVHIEHERLPDADSVEETRTYWKERLARLVDQLSK
jgi:hypothetical protein